MNRILIDTMHLAKLLKDKSYHDLAAAIRDRELEAIVSVVSLAELTKRLGMEDVKRMRQVRQDLLSTRLVFVNVNRTIAIQAGEMRLKYDIPTADSMIAATGLVENTINILTSDQRHFGPIKNLIKKINLKEAEKMAKQ
ncbi:MAG TPA: PIN domain-containing protein [Candidatus Methylomirabilis sp.]|nr:PIN domain-containing protein [Candidatus Methylomirabilis sp.]